MCGRFGLFVEGDTLAEALGSPSLSILRIERHYNIAPGQWFVIVRPEKSERVPSLARWGFIPSWSKDPDAGPKPINARAEGIASKPMFRGAFKHGRCLIPASGFYEWQKVGSAKTRTSFSAKVEGYSSSREFRIRGADRKMSCAQLPSSPPQPTN